MPRATRETQIYRKDAKLNHNLLTAAEREKLLEVCSTTARILTNTDRQLAVPSIAPVPISYKTWRKVEHPNYSNRQTEGTFKTRSPQIPPQPITRPPLRHRTHDFLCLYTVAAGISCGEGQDTGYSVLSPPNSRAYSKGCQGLEPVADASECDIEAGGWRTRWCWA